MGEPQPSDGTPGTCFRVMLHFTKMRLIVKMLTPSMFMFVEYLPNFKYLIVTPTPSVDQVRLMTPSTRVALSASALAASMLAKFSKWLHWGLFAAG